MTFCEGPIDGRKDHVIGKIKEAKFQGITLEKGVRSAVTGQVSSFNGESRIETPFRKGSLLDAEGEVLPLH